MTQIKTIRTVATSHFIGGNVAHWIILDNLKRVEHNDGARRTLLGSAIVIFTRGSMYCPRCGQQQISDEMKFCSRCGLPIGGLVEWLAGAGPPAVREQEKQVSLRSPRRKGIRRGAKLLFLSVMLFPVFLVLSLAVDEGGPLVIPIIIFFVALAMMLYARLFSEEISPVKSQRAQIPALGAMSGHNALPPASNIGTYGPVNLAGQQVRTAELAQPPSVTENTTKLLDQE